MRYFWFLIAALLVLTGVLNIARRAGEARGASAPAAGQPPVVSMARPTQHSAPQAAAVSDPGPQAATEITASERVSDQGELDAAVSASDAPVVVVAPAGPIEVAREDTAADSEPVSGPESGQTGEPDASLDALLGVDEDNEDRSLDDGAVEAVAGGESRDSVSEAVLEETITNPERDDAPVVDSEQTRPGPAFTVRGDGSVEVEGAGIIVGDGSPQRPYVLDWSVMRSVARDYNPKQGQEQLPEWVMQLDGKAVRVEGNTLLPVVAAAVDELLVMQNPWDGCCIGIPPTPYDAIEVKLAELTQMGYSVMGFGTVEGTFKVDPYIVQGWLLGLYLIEDASFESAAGMELPGF